MENSDIENEHQPAFAYSVKVVNPLRMKEFHTIDLGTGKVYKKIVSLREFISKNLPNIPDFDMQNVELGYIEPGHGMKGKKVWLYTDGDVQNMYERYQGKPSIRLWCYTCKANTKTSGKDSSKTETAKSGLKQHEENSKRSEIDDIYEQLQEKHKGKYKPEQLRAWSHMIRLKTHDSLNEPPDKPFFRGRKRQVGEIQSPSGKAPANKRLCAPPAVSPGRKVNIRSELIDQLEKWHKLLDLGVIAQREYDDLKEKILSDIKQL